MSKIAPCLWFDRNAAEAAAFYTRLFPASSILSTGYYGESMPMPEGTVLVVEFELAGQRFQALNGGPVFKMNPSISFFVQLDDEREARRLFEALREGGIVRMPLAAYPWSPCYGWVEDRFGASFQIIVGRKQPGDPTIVPCLMFSDTQHGKAEAAIQLYASVFEAGRIEGLERYQEGEGPVGTIKHGRFALAGQEFVAMDSHVTHNLSFNEGISLSIRCRDQREVDRLWDALTQGGGSPGQCGWLKDRFGVSWQVVPEALVALQARGDARANSRMFQAMLRMTRLDVAALERAYSAG